jgi:hypothetical protein
MRVITLSDLNGKNPFNLCILGENKKDDTDIVEAINYILMRDFYSDGGNYHIHTEHARHSDFVVVVTTDTCIEPVATYMARVQTVPVYGT